MTSVEATIRAEWRRAGDGEGRRSGVALRGDAAAVDRPRARGTGAGIRAPVGLSAGRDGPARRRSRDGTSRAGCRAGGTARAAGPGYSRIPARPLGWA